MATDYGPQIRLYQEAMNATLADAAKAMQAITSAPFRLPAREVEHFASRSEPPYEGSRAGWYPSKPRRLNGRQRAAQRALGHLWSEVR